MKDALKFILLMLVASSIILGGIHYQDYKNQTKQHIKVQRVGCHQYRINEYNNTVTHLEGCNSAEHLNEAE